MANEVKATIKSIGDAFVVTAGFKYETAKNLIKYGKENALVLVDEKTKDPYFGVVLGDTTEISRFGITFTGANKEGYAECTGCFPKTSMSDEEKKAFLRDNLAYAVSYLNEVQKQVEAAEKDLKAIIATVDNAITIA
jgi:hypothetical protein